MQYEQLWTLYRDGIRTASGLSRRTGSSRATCKRAIENGWPGKNWPPLRERALLWDKQRAEESERAAAEAFRERADAIYRVQKRVLARLDETTDIGFAALALVRKAFEASTFTKTRRVRRVIDGTVQEVDEDYIPTEAVARAFRSVAASIRDLGTYERNWLSQSGASSGAGARADEPTEEAPPVRPLTADEVRRIVETSQLPIGCTDDQLIATLQMVAGAPPAKGTTPR